MASQDIYNLNSNSIKSILDLYKEKIYNILKEELRDNNLDRLYSKIEQISLNLDTYKKKQRMKNVVNSGDRCLAKRADGLQCSRKKKNGCCYCGTHIKGCPHGKYNKEEISESKTISVSALDIGGIVYFIDDNNNIYDTEDIMEQKINPRVIGVYKKELEKIEMKSVDIE